jgi:hypothetical protein
LRRGEGRARRIVSIMSGADRKGRWRLAPHATALNRMGGSDLDLEDVERSDERTELRVYSIMGGSDIRVPEGMNVEVSEFAFMGGNDIDVADPGGPVLRVRLFSLIGGSDVKRGRKQARRWRHRLHGWRQ